MHGGFAVAALSLILAAGCIDAGNGAYVPRHAHGASEVFVRVAPLGGAGSAWLLEQAKGNVFTGGKIEIWAGPGEHLGAHRLGAWPTLSSKFAVWPGIGQPIMDPLPEGRAVVVPTQGGPWRGMVVELRADTRYPAAMWSPVPYQTPSRRPVFTVMRYCHRPDSGSCMTWARAAASGHVRCETRRGRPLKAERCQWYVPDSHWHVIGLVQHPW